MVRKAVRQTVGRTVLLLGPGAGHRGAGVQGQGCRHSRDQTL